MTQTLIDLLKWLNRTTSSELSKVIRRLERRIIKEQGGFTRNADVLKEALARVERDKVVADDVISRRIKITKKLIGRAL